MRKNVATVAKLPHRTTCTCPLLSMSSEGPMVGAGVAQAEGARQSFRGGHMGTERCVLLGETFVQIRNQSSGNVLPLKCCGESPLFLLGC